MPDGNTLRQIILRFVLISENCEQLVNDIESINESIKVMDTQGHDMCYTFDARSFLMRR